MYRKDEETIAIAIGIIALFVCASPFLLARLLLVNVGIPTRVTFTMLGLTVVACTWLYFSRRYRRFRAIQLSNIDSMRGIEFERYLMRLLESQGYRVSMTPASGDFGVDIVAIRNSERIAVQAKRYNGKVSRRAISDAVAGMMHYNCNRAMVITNSQFTPGAITLAHSTNCVLVDREMLTQWIIQLQDTHSRDS